MISDVQLLTLCAFQEADGECDEGLAAIPKVALNRTRLKYASDGTICGTILRHDQFSWTEWSMVNETYELVAHNPQQELARVEQLLATDEKSVAQWARCSRIVAAVMAETFKGPLFDQLTPTTVLYDNIALAQPSWIATVRHVVKIQHHDFFEPNALKAA
jgi:hypothetical protein